MKIVIVRTQQNAMYIGRLVAEGNGYVKLSKPAELKINPVFDDQANGQQNMQQNQQENPQRHPVMMNFVLIVPFEMGGIHVDENLYTGFSGNVPCVDECLSASMKDYGFHMLKSRVFEKVTHFVTPLDGVADFSSEFSIYGSFFVVEASDSMKKLYEIYEENYEIVVRSPRSCYLYFGDNRQVEFVRGKFGNIIMPQQTQGETMGMGQDDGEEVPRVLS